jgi:hypothetical protein
LSGFDLDGAGTAARGPLLVTDVGEASGGLALAAAIATTAAGGGRPVLMSEAGSPQRPMRATLLCSPAARELERRLAAAGCSTAVARGAVCFASLPGGEDLFERAAAAFELLPPAGACVIFVAQRLWQEALARPDLRPTGALLNADVQRDRALVALAVRDLHRRGLAVRVASRAPGWAAARRALAGLSGGSDQPRMRRWSRLLLGAEGRWRN